MSPVRWDGFSHTEIFRLVADVEGAARVTKLEDYAAGLTGRQQLLSDALSLVYEARAQYAASGSGAATDAGVASIGAAAQRFQTVVQQADTTATVVNDVAGRLRVAHDKVADLPPYPPASRLNDPGDLPLSWVASPPADEQDALNSENRQRVRDAMAGYERGAVQDLDRLRPLRVAPLPGPALPGSTLPGSAPPTPALNGRLQLGDETTVPALPTVPMAGQPMGPQARIRTVSYGPTGHVEEDRPTDRLDQPDDRPSSRRRRWQEDEPSQEPIMRGRTSGATFFDADQNVVPRVIGESSAVSEGWQ